MARQLHCAIGLLCCIAPVFVCSSIDHFKLQAHELLLLLLLLGFLQTCSPNRHPPHIIRLPRPVLPACLQCAPPCSCLPLSSPQWWPLTPATSRRASATSPASEPSVLEGVVVVWLAAAGGLSPRSRKHPPPYLLTLAHPSASHLAAGGLMRARMMKSRSCGSRC